MGLAYEYEIITWSQFYQSAALNVSYVGFVICGSVSAPSTLVSQSCVRLLVWSLWYWRLLFTFIYCPLTSPLYLSCLSKSTKERREKLTMRRSTRVKWRLQPPGECFSFMSDLADAFSFFYNIFWGCIACLCEAFPKQMLSIWSLSPAVICPLAVKLDLLFTDVYSWTSLHIIHIRGARSFTLFTFEDVFLIFFYLASQV